MGYHKINFETLKGKKYGRLTVIEVAGKNKHGHTLMKCVCDCGNEKNVAIGDLNCGSVSSCGCLGKENKTHLGKISRKHGMCNTRLYRIYKGMLGRCNNPNKSDYKYYGAKGVTVSKEWEENPKKFIEWSLNNGYRDGLTIDRIDVTKGYCSDNCRWIEFSKQATNKRNSVYLEYKGVRKPLVEWAKQLGVSQYVLYGRRRLGYTDEETIGGLMNGI